MPESTAQRKARERNLRKGNPAAYGAGALGGAEDPPREEQNPAQGGAQEAPRTFRARAKGTPKGARTPKPRKTPARAPGPAQEPPRERPSASQGGGGFLGGLLEGFGG